MRRLLWVLVGLLCMTGSAWAACTGASPSWSCATWAEMEALIEGASINPNDTVTLAAGTHAVASTITFTKKVTVRGSGTKATTLSGNGTMFGIGATGSRVTNFVINSTGGYAITARHQDWRVDNNTLDCRPSGAKCRIVVYNAQGYPCPTTRLGGLIDSNILYNAYPSFYGNSYGESASSFACYAEALDLGGKTAVYVEDNTFYSDVFGDVMDSDFGGAYVARFNQIYKTTAGGSAGFVLDAHGFRIGTYAWRSSPKWEWYHNTIQHGSNGTFTIRGGTGVTFNNTILPIAPYAAAIQQTIDRGTDLCNGTDTVRDSNEIPVGQTDAGWLCRDQVGAGKDAYAWTGTGNYPPQEKVPAYHWGNGINASEGPHVRRGRDFYDESGDGVRIGTTLPATCTPYQGYWKTDEGFWNNTTPGVAAGSLYKCTATNTWTPYYTPYPYPHPLRTGLSAPTGVK